MGRKKRIDLLVAEKLGISRGKAQAIILAGQVLVGNNVADKAGQEIDIDEEITIKEIFPYVSRGALKIEQAAAEFDIDFTEKTICDIGASTGGFTDYALQHGAKKVYAIDCGYGQIDQKLRNDKRVINMERTNIKDVEKLPEPIDIFVIDVSFISLKRVLPQVITIIRNSKFEIQNSSDVIALVKPQFEVGKKVADKYRGIIRDEKIRKEVLDDIQTFASDLGYTIEGSTGSPIKGAKGNSEYLLYLRLKH